MAGYQSKPFSSAKSYMSLPRHTRTAGPSINVVQGLDDLSARPQRRLLVEAISLRRHVIEGMMQSPRYQTLGLDLVVMAQESRIAGRWIDHVCGVGEEHGGLGCGRPSGIGFWHCSMTGLAYLSWKVPYCRLRSVGWGRQGRVCNPRGRVVTI